eukprot:CAMPEP_0172534158 /NCGR_PEP_ID=MMETSP1067-20121228/6620_1 /TAXON_ID=265564 ORGANISM="Thalassiosira punctigera, Strain Tpunct2005C2" /NCGR_SAMPLE_ID=MMETSP1067 /ASSEMBLY_ACC=CAM_ASM_000444 /LENGTH=109 /DNA_ID=CAMNT_0013318913 /DNA_START=141 /DNA_END=470 /DNA_ORIENTATION=-
MIRGTILLVAVAALGRANAFAPTGTTARAVGTRLFVEQEEVMKTLEGELKSDPMLKEASRATVLECDDVECATAQCTQDKRGNWHCDGGLEGDRENIKTQVLMHSDDDD